MIQIIPAIDLIAGSCVRLREGDFSRSTIYSDDPLEMARRFEDAGMQRLHLVDLDGARTGRVAHLNVLESIATHTRLAIDYSGGIRNEADAESVFNAGARYIGIGSLAVREPALLQGWITRWGAEAIILSADVRNDRIAMKGWEEQTEVLLFDFLDFWTRAGICNVCCTDITRDGMMEGPSLALYERIRERWPSLQLIASGGVSRIADVEVLEEIGCAGVIIGTALYQGTVLPGELRKFYAT